MTGSRPSRTCTALASLLAALAAAVASPSPARARGPLPVYLEDNHAGTLQFLAGTLELAKPHVLVLVDAHSDASPPRDLARLRAGLDRVASAEERDEALTTLRREGAVQSFDWIAALVPRPLAEVLWVAEGAAAPSESLPADATPEPPAELPARLPANATVDTPPELPPRLPAGFTRITLEELPGRLPAELPVVATIDLDSFAGLPAPEQRARFEAVWSAVLSLPRLTALSFAISRPWLASDAEASRLVFLALDASLRLAHASVAFAPWGLEGPDRSERAKAYYLRQTAPPRFDLESASPELRALLVARADELHVPHDAGRWPELLARWRAEAGEWRVSVQGAQAESDGVFRLAGGDAPELRVVGGPPGLVREVTWLQWRPTRDTYDVLPELPAGKTFAGVAPPTIEYAATVLARTDSVALEPEVWVAAFSGPANSGVLRISAEVKTAEATTRTARIEVRRSVEAGFRGGLSEGFGLPYVFGAGFLRRAGLHGPDTGVGNDCANFLVAGWRRSGLRMPWSNPAQLRGRLVPVAKKLTAAQRVPMPAEATARGLVVHLGSHVAALWEDLAPLGTLGREDVVAHHLGGPPELISLGQLLDARGQPAFDLYLGPTRQATSWIAVGGDVMPGDDGPPPEALRAVLAKADLAVANLETTVGGKGKPASKRYVFRIAPERLTAVRELGLSAVSLANNHAGDHGAEGLASTLSALDAAGIGHFGAGADRAAAFAPWYREVNGSTVAFLSVSLTDPDLLPAGASAPGVAVLPGHERELAAALAAAREKARTVIVLPHWGDEGSTLVAEQQHRWARWLVAHGADAVVGSGPHLVQGRESVAGVPVVYSVGNLWFSGKWPAEYRTAGVAFLGLDERGRVVETRVERVAAPGGTRVAREARRGPQD